MTSRRWATALWLIWLAYAGWTSAEPFGWLLEAFRRAGFYGPLIWGLPLFGITAGLHLWIRRRGLWRYEPVIIAAACATAFLFYRFWASLLLAGIFLACFAAGAWLRSRLGLDEASPAATEIPISTALGLALYGPVLFVLGLLNLYYWWVFAVVFAAPVVFLYRRWIGLGVSLAGLWDGWKDSTELRSPLAGIAVIFIALAGGIATVVMLAPTVGWDAIHFHLREASFYVDHHGLTPLPGLDYSFYPGAYEVLAAAMVALGGPPAAQLFSAMPFALTCLLVYRLARESGSPPAPALAGIAALVTLPVFHWTASVPKNDMILVWFELAALGCFLQWRRTASFRWILVAAFLTASAFDVKHTALFGAIPLVALLMFAAWQQRSCVLAIAQVAVFLALTGSYWHVRTFMLTGSPVFPNSAGSAAPAAGVPGSSAGLVAGSVERYVRVIRETHFDGTRFFDRPLRTPLGISLVMFWPVWILFRRRAWNKELAILIGFAAVYLMYWIYTYPVPRYALPALLILFGSTAARFAEGLLAESRRYMQALLLAAAGYTFTFGLLGCAIIGLNAPHLRWVARQVGDIGYLREALETYRATEYLESVAAPGDTVLGLEFFPSLYTSPFLRITGISLPAKTLPLQDPDYRWLVAPVSFTAPLDPANWIPRHRDDYYVVYSAHR